MCVVAHSLIDAGCSGSILSREEREELLCHACHEVDLFVIEFLLQSGCRISILSNEEQEELLYLACREHNMFVVDAAFKNGCSVSILSIEITKKSFIVPATKVMRLL